MYIKFPKYNHSSNIQKFLHCHKQLSKEKIGVLACNILCELTPQLGKIADDLPPLVAAYYDIPVEEACKKDAAEVINDLVNDDGIVNFFKNALRKRAGQEH